MTSPVLPNSYEATVLEAHALRGEPKAMKGAEFISIFRAGDRSLHFAVRGSRSDSLRLEGFVEIARMNLAGLVSVLEQPQVKVEEITTQEKPLT